jgi:hypothetical protein
VWLAEIAPAMLEQLALPGLVFCTGFEGMPFKAGATPDKNGAPGEPRQDPENRTRLRSAR